MHIICHFSEQNISSAALEPSSASTAIPVLPSVLMVIEELGEEFASRADQTEEEGSSLITAPSYQNGGSVSRKSYIYARRKWDGASVELVAHDATVQEAGASAMIT